MKAMARRVPAILLSLVLTPSIVPVRAAQRDQPPAAGREQVLKAYASLPLAFVENRGQADARARYSAQGPRYAFHLKRDEVLLSFDRDPDPPAALALRFVGSNPRVEIDGEERTPGEFHYFHGNDPAQWHTGVPAYAQVVYRDLWPGVDLALRGQARQLKYEFRVRPGARVEDIRLGYRGQAGLTLDGAGALLIQTAQGTLRDSPPVSYQQVAGRRVPVDSRYVLKEGGSAEAGYGFAVGAEYDASRELVIDPGLDYSTLLGGSSHDSAAEIVVDASGNAYIVGTTQSQNFPTTAGAFDRTLASTNNVSDVFVTKLNATGTALVYSTFLGGSAFDVGRGIAVDAAGNAYVTGHHPVAEFPHDLRRLPARSLASARPRRVPTTPRMAS